MIIRRDFYFVEIILESPLSIGNGTANSTDKDVLVDKDGNPFIPGTTIAGVFTDYLEKCQIKDAFQPKKNNQYIQSPVFFSDGVLKGDMKTNVRDGIRLKDDCKIPEDGAKYDFEIIERGTKFVFRIEIISRYKEDYLYKDYIDQCLKAMDHGLILFGSKTTRGLGKVKIALLKHKCFHKDDVKDYLKFNPYNEYMYDNYSLDNVVLKPLYLTIKLVLKLMSGISIRTYNANAQQEDYHHITDKNGHAIIPGTSWNGLIRKQFIFYYEKVLKHKHEEIDELFGMVQNKTSMKSKIIIEENIIHGGEDVLITRTSIDRFSGGAVERSLFTERTHYYGDTQLVIRIPQELVNDDVITAFDCIVKDLDNGFIALGGQTSIGRGLFKVISKEGI